MKFRTYTVNSIKDTKYFCPNCHRIIENNFLNSSNIIALNGFNINCGFCNNGKIKIITSNAKNNNVVKGDI